jgi:hypothetical protein
MLLDSLGLAMIHGLLERFVGTTAVRVASLLGREVERSPSGQGFDNLRPLERCDGLRCSHGTPTPEMAHRTPPAPTPEAVGTVTHFRSGSMLSACPHAHWPRACAFGPEEVLAVMKDANCRSHSIRQRPNFPATTGRVTSGTAFRGEPCGFFGRTPRLISVRGKALARQSRRVGQAIERPLRR